jgi:hypothetical protein
MLLRSARAGTLGIFPTASRFAMLTTLEKLPLNEADGNGWARLELTAIRSAVRIGGKNRKIDFRFNRRRAFILSLFRLGG